MTSGKITEWKKQVGDAVEAGEALYTIETDKSNIDVEAPYSGTLKEILVPAGETADVDADVAIIED